MKDLNVSDTDSVSKHPLDRKINTITCWWEWLQKWDKAETIEEMIGLLHVGFSRHISTDTPHMHGITDIDTPSYTEEDRLIFYFRVANGWRNYGELRSSSDTRDLVFDYYDPNTSHEDYSNSKKLEKCQLRAIIAQKAATCLYKEYFKKCLQNLRDHDEYNDCWQRFAPPSLLVYIMDFFRAEKNRFRGFGISNFPHADSPQAKHVEMFIIALARYIWQWQPMETLGMSPERVTCIQKNNAEMISIFPALREWLTHLLCEIKQYELLWKRILLPFSQIEIDTLTARAFSLAMPSFSEFDEDTFPSTTEEAVLTESPESILLLRLKAHSASVRTVTRENRKREKIKRAKKVLEKASVA